MIAGMRRAMPSHTQCVQCTRCIQHTCNVDRFRNEHKVERFLKNHMRSVVHVPSAFSLAFCNDIRDYIIYSNRVMCVIQSPTVSSKSSHYDYAERHIYIYILFTHISCFALLQVWFSNIPIFRRNYSVPYACGIVTYCSFDMHAIHLLGRCQWILITNMWLSDFGPVKWKCLVNIIINKNQWQVASNLQICWI